MFKSETIKAATRRVAVGLGGAAMLSVAAPASASQLIYLQSATMVTTFQASISGIGNAYSNGVTFTVSDSSNGSNPYSLYGFCIDIYHHMYINTPLNYQYISYHRRPWPAALHELWAWPRQPAKREPDRRPDQPGGHRLDPARYRPGLVRSSDAHGRDPGGDLEGGEP